jgi:hypothetical protein
VKLRDALLTLNCLMLVVLNCVLLLLASEVSW